MRPLEDTQREFFAALQMPLRGTSRASTELPPNDEGHSPSFFAMADALMKGSDNLSSAERLELYHRQYWFRVLDSIAEDFPILRKMAGEERFWTLMEDYLRACPSESFTLRHLGSRVPDFTASWAGVDELRRRWFAAIARIEYARMECYEAAEWEPVPQDQFATARLGLQPHVQLLELSVPADECEAWEIFEPVDETPVHLAVWRGPNGGHQQARVDAIEYLLLCRLCQGRTLASIFEDPVPREPTPDEVTRWFQQWQSRRWIALAPEGNPELLAVVRHRDAGDVDWNGVDKMGSQARPMEE